MCILMVRLKNSKQSTVCKKIKIITQNFILLQGTVQSILYWHCECQCRKTMTIFLQKFHLRCPCTLQVMFRSCVVIFILRHTCVCAIPLLSFSLHVCMMGHFHSFFFSPLSATQGSHRDQSFEFVLFNFCEYHNENLLKLLMLLNIGCNATMLMSISIFLPYVIKMC